MSDSAGTNSAAPEYKAAPRGWWFDRLRERVAASDPALSRLRLASRVLLSLLLSAAILAGITMLHPLPVAAYGLAVVVSFTGASAIRGKPGRRQLVTRLLAGVASIAAVSIASLLAPLPVVADLAFLGVIFAAAYVRQYGNRWFAVGMIAFMSYFIGDYLRPQPGDIGWVASAAAIALLVTHVVTNLILRDAPERDFRRALATIDHRINLIVRDLRDAAGRGRPNPDRRPMQVHLARLRDIVLMAEGFIPQGDEGSLAAEGAASELALALFELQLTVERMVRASYLVLPPDELLAAVLHGDDGAIARAKARVAGAGEEVSARLLLRMHRARRRLDAALEPAPSRAFANAGDGAPKGAATEPTPEARRAGFSVPLPLQLPIQVTLACAIAMAGGLLLSPMRWYWAVVTAFIVFNNTKSRADTAIRALQRSAGTFAGLVAGTAIATLAQGHLLASAVGIPIMFFLAFYFLQASYGVMIFFFTIALALLYGLMGTFTPELLLLRLEETMIGSVAGAAVAFLVFPARASVGVGEALDGFLQALGELVAAAARRARGEPATGNLVALSRVLDRRYADLANAARPLGGPWNVVTRFGEVREKLLLLAGCAHWGRTVVRSLRDGQALPPESRDRIAVLADEIDARIGKAEAIRTSFFERPHLAEGEVSAASPRPPLPITEDEDATFSLEVISALLDRATR